MAKLALIFIFSSALLHLTLAQVPQDSDYRAVSEHDLNDKKTSTLALEKEEDDGQVTSFWLREVPPPRRRRYHNFHRYRMQLRGGFTAGHDRDDAGVDDQFTEEEIKYWRAYFSEIRNRGRVDDTTLRNWPFRHGLREVVGGLTKRIGKFLFDF